MQLFDVNCFEIQAPYFQTHHYLEESRNKLDIVVQQNVRYLPVIVSDILEFDCISMVCHILDHDTTTKLTSYKAYKLGKVSECCL